MLISVVTPTFNRGHLIHRVYESLLKQTYQNFEWIVVDDGSSDNTRLIIEEWIKKSTFAIKYYYQINSGQNVALNTGIKASNGDFFVQADSDDEFYPKAFEIFTKTWQKIINESMFEKTDGIWCLCENEKNTLIGQAFKKESFFNYHDIFFNLTYIGEKWHIIKMETMKQNLFPIAENKLRYYIPESTVWAKIFKTQFLYTINIPLRKYYSSPDGIINQKLSEKSKLSQSFYFRYLLKEHSDLIVKYPAFFFKNLMILTKIYISLKINNLTNYLKYDKFQF